jgi:long-chain acyl-CoA synthetase
MTVGLPLTVVNAFDRAARWFPNNEAVVDSGSRLSYRTLDDQSRRCAALLASLGAQRGQPVAILAAPSSIFMVAWLGIVRLGAVAMALHTREATPVLARICQKIQPTLLIYDASMEAAAAAIAAETPTIRATVRALSALPAEAAVGASPAAIIPTDLPQFPDDFPLASSDEDDPAIIVLSSGTTSLAKGIVHSHRTLIELARCDLYLYGGLKPSDRSLVPLSTAFIGCYNGWLPFLNVGGCTVFMERFDLAELPRLVSDERITHVFLTPTLWRRLLLSNLTGVDFSSVRQVGFAAEVMAASTLQKLRERISPNVVQMYGSSELGAAATCIWAEDMVGDRIASVGRPMVNCDLRIVVPGGRPSEEVPDGEVGEVLVSSPSLAVGIWHDPAMNGSLFVEEDGKRWWRSRDLGRVDAGGFLFIEGRHDDMIISAGINIMPARVEEVLMSHAAVRDCAVIGVPHPEFGEQVQAYVVSTDVGLDAAVLEKHMMASELSPYQRPRKYFFVDELPRTPTNKVSRKILREWAAKAGALHQASLSTNRPDRLT